MVETLRDTTTVRGLDADILRRFGGTVFTSQGKTRSALKEKLFVHFFSFF
jgi:hypothetical protein